MAPLYGQRIAAVDGREDPKEGRRLRLLCALLTLGAAGCFAAALVPGSNGASRAVAPARMVV